MPEFGAILCYSVVQCLVRPMCSARCRGTALPQRAAGKNDEKQSLGKHQSKVSTWTRQTMLCVLFLSSTMNHTNSTLNPKAAEFMLEKIQVVR